MKWQIPPLERIPFAITTHGFVTIVFENPGTISVWVDVDGMNVELKPSQPLVVSGKNIYLENKHNTVKSGEFTVTGPQAGS